MSPYRRNKQLSRVVPRISLKKKLWVYFFSDLKKRMEIRRIRHSYQTIEYTEADWRHRQRLAKLAWIIFEGNRGPKWPWFLILGFIFGEIISQIVLHC